MRLTVAGAALLAALIHRPSGTRAQQPDTNARTRAAVEAYFDGLNRKDIGAVPFAPDVVFTTPMLPAPLHGEAAVRAFVQGTLPGFTGATVERHIVEGEHAFTLFDIDWPQRGGVIKSSDYFHVVNGRIREIRVYFDPRPLLDRGGIYQPPEPRRRP